MPSFAMDVTCGDKEMFQTKDLIGKGEYIVVLPPTHHMNVDDVKTEHLNNL